MATYNLNDDMIESGAKGGSISDNNVPKIFVNDGDINWNGNWQVTCQAKTLHASTNLTINSGAGSQSVSWTGDSATVHVGCVILIPSYAGTGTFQVALEENTGAWTVKASTTLATTAATKGGGYFYFKFSGTYTETGNSFRINVTRTAGAGSITVRADAASVTNVGITCVTNATHALESWDKVFITGITQASTANPTTATVTLNGDYSASLSGWIIINNGGVLTYGNQAATNYYLRVEGSNPAAANLPLLVYNGGTLTINGDTATSSVLEFYPNYGTDRACEMEGTMTVTGKNNIGTSKFRTNLTGTVSANGTSLTVVDDVQTAGWAADDVISISATGAVGY